MSREAVTEVAAIPGKRLYEYLIGAVLIATILSFLAYSATLSYAAIFKIEGLEPTKIAVNTFYIAGTLAVAGTLILLAIQAG